MGVRTYDGEPRPRARVVGPGLAPAAAVAAIAFVLLMANGRPLGAPQETGAAGLVLRAVLAVLGLVLELDPTGRALVGKGLASACAGVAAGALFAAVGRRHSLADGRVAGLVLAVGTTLAGASQSWSAESPATAAVALAVLLLVRAEDEDDPAPAARAAVPLAAAVVLLPSTWLLALVAAAAPFARFPRGALRLLAWTVPAAAVAAMAMAGGARLLPAEAAGDTGPLARVVSPARGALVFAPAALVGLAGIFRALRSRAHGVWDARTASRWLPLTALAAGFAHVGWVAFQGEAAAGPSWGPRLFAPAWPAVLLFLPEGLALLRVAGAMLVVLSVAIQALGAFAYHGGGDRRPREGGRERVWDLARSPIALLLRERAVRPALPGLEGRRLVVREHPMVLGGPQGSRVTFAGATLRVEGADATLGDVLVEGGARVQDGRLRLAEPEDALFFRVREEARPRRLELRLRGRGPGTLVVEERTFRTPPRRREHPVGGVFRLRLPYAYAESGGGDVRILSRGGPIALESVSLVPPSEPEDVIRLP